MLYERYTTWKKENTALLAEICFMIHLAIDTNKYAYYELQFMQLFFFVLNNAYQLNLELASYEVCELVFLKFTLKKIVI